MESHAHQQLGPFDWPAAVETLRASVTRACRCETVVLTESGWVGGGPVYAYATREPSLMIWILEVTLRYLKSDAFDRDTVMVSPDMLVLGDLRPWFTADLGLVARPGQKYIDKPLLNGLQWWAHRAKASLVRFYERAREMATRLSVESKVWGADTEALLDLVRPIGLGTVDRSGLNLRFIDQAEVIHECSSHDVDALAAGLVPPRHRQPVVDFKYLRKRYLAQYAAAVGL
jgi:hypothetical protein